MVATRLPLDAPSLPTGYAPGRLVGRSAEVQRRQQRYRRTGPTVDELDLALGADPVQLRRLDAAVGDVHDGVLWNNHVLYGDPLPVQRHGAGGEDPGAVHAAAAHGLKGGGGAMPHLARIQEAFGRHDVSGVQAHVGGAAREGAEAMGAEAYATGSHVAFRGAPDLHTAAHEAAHIVQQRAGVSLSGGVGQVGDAYEQHADRVADAVVRGESAEGLLDTMSGGGGGGAGVQRSTSGRQTVNVSIPDQSVNVGGKLSIKPSIPAIPIWGPIKLKLSVGLDATGEIGMAANGKKGASGVVTGKVALKVGGDVGFIIDKVFSATGGVSVSAATSAKFAWGSGWKKLTLSGIRISSEAAFKLDVMELLERKLVVAKGDLIEIGSLEVGKNGDEGWYAKPHGVRVLSPTLKGAISDISRKQAENAANRKRASDKLDSYGDIPISEKFTRQLQRKPARDARPVTAASGERVRRPVQRRAAAPVQRTAADKAGVVLGPAWKGFAAMYFEPFAQELLAHYIGGTGGTLNLSKKQMDAVKADFDIQGAAGFSSAIKTLEAKAKAGGGKASVPFDAKGPATAGAPNTLGNFTVRYKGTLVMEGGKWRFEGHIQFIDFWDFDVKMDGSRSWQGELKTIIGATTIPGKPYDVSGWAPFTAKSGGFRKIG